MLHKVSRLCILKLKTLRNISLYYKKGQLIKSWLSLILIFIIAQSRETLRNGGLCNSYQCYLSLLLTLNESCVFNEIALEIFSLLFIMHNKEK